jgi:hypothetical protein
MRETAAAGGMIVAVPRPHLRRSALEVIAMLAAGAILAIVGPYGTFSQGNLAERMIYWIGVILIAFLLYRPACALAARTARQLDLPEGLGWAAAVLLGTFPVTLLVWLASYRHTPSLWPTLPEYVGFYGSVVVIGGGLMLLIWLVHQAAGGSAVASPSQPSPEQVLATPACEPPIVIALPPALRGELIALEMEDHYVRVHTSRGSHLLLMRMRDAVAATGGVAGAQVHRSWWVAREAVKRFDRDGRKAQVTLRNGLAVPVSRDRLNALPLADWSAGQGAG